MEELRYTIHKQSGESNKTIYLVQEAAKRMKKKIVEQYNGPVLDCGMKGFHKNLGITVLDWN